MGVDGRQNPHYKPRMNKSTLLTLLEQVRDGGVEVGAAVLALEQLPFSELEDAVVDHHRALRQHVPEVIFAPGKTVEQIVSVARAILDHGQNLLITRLDEKKAAGVCQSIPELNYESVARVGVYAPHPVVPLTDDCVAVVTAGTSDIPVAEEVMATLKASGVPTIRIVDVGVAGIHRLFAKLEPISKAKVVIVVAGMEGALASVLGGIISGPLIAVPTSVGYGVSRDGYAALIGMLSSCAAGVTVVNIDNGFGAAMAAVRILAGSKS